MEYVVKGLGFLLIPVIIIGVFEFFRHPIKSEAGKVFLSKFLALAGSVSSAIFLVPTFITAFSDEPVWIPIGFFAFSLLCSALTIAFINCRISYDEEGFVAKNFFGFKRQFSYNQVTAIEENLHETYLYVGKRRVMIDKFSTGGSEFIALVKKRYRTTHNGLAIPKIQKTKNDIFNGNVLDAGGFIFVYIMISVVIVVFAAFLVWYVFFSGSTADNTIEQQTTFESYVIDNNEITFTSSDNYTYKVDFIGEQLSNERLESMCDGKTVVTTYSKKITPDDEDAYYVIKAIRIDDTYLLSFEETNSLHVQEYWKLLLFPAIFAIVWAIYVVGSIVVGRNPKKYSKNIVRLFFKDGYVKY